MSLEVHLDWQGRSHPVGRLHAAERGPSVTFEYATEWLQRDDAFAVDPTSLPLQRGAHHGAALFGAIQDCGPDRWGRMLIERAVRKKVLTQKPYRDIDYVLALDDVARVGALRFRVSAESPFLAATTGKLPPLVRLSALLRATDAIHTETETAQDLRFLLGAGSPLGGAHPKSAVSLADERFAMAKFPQPGDTRDIAAGEILALTLATQAGIQAAEHRLVRVGGQGVAIINRFDRAGKNRIPACPLPSHPPRGMATGGFCFENRAIDAHRRKELNAVYAPETDTPNSLRCYGRRVRSEQRHKNCQRAHR